MTACVVLSRNLGNVWSVTIEPPVPGTRMNESMDDFNGACGYGAAMAASLWRPLVDMTGTFSADECDELVGRAMVKLAIDEVMG